MPVESELKVARRTLATERDKLRDECRSLTEAVTYETRLQAGDDAQSAPVAGLNIEHWVGRTGLEPVTDRL